MTPLLGIPALLSLIVAVQAQRTCQPAYQATTDYSGCYPDPGFPRTLDGPVFRSSVLNSPQYCANICGARGFAYAGVEYGKECWCGSSIGTPDAKVGDDQCTYSCPGDSSQICGGSNLLNIYSITNGLAPSPDTAFGDCTRDPLCSNDVCDTTKSPEDRANALIAALSLQEKAGNLGTDGAGGGAAGLPPFEWWTESLHGVGASPAVNWNSPLGSEWSAATMFPMPILMSAAFDDKLISRVADVISTEVRAFSNAGHAGFSVFTPNMNPPRDPRWGRSHETPGEDPLRTGRYSQSLVKGLQGGDNPDLLKVLATCKHYAVYDIEDRRLYNDVSPTARDLADYYLYPFKACVAANPAAVMCSYNSVYGTPACANSYLMDVLREDFGFGAPHNYVVSDCDAVSNIWNTHSNAANVSQAAAMALNAGTDLDCGLTYDNLVDAVSSGMTDEATLDRSLVRLFTALIKAGYFTSPRPWGNLTWDSVNTTATRGLALEAATAGMTLLKNTNKTLPLAHNMTLAIIGPFANDSLKALGNYLGISPVNITPVAVFQDRYGSDKIRFVHGVDVNSSDTSSFADALDAANQSDGIIYLGGIDSAVEAEDHDRTSIDWPGQQLSLISQLSALNKTMVVVQYGGGQIDDSGLLADPNVGAILWAGYPGQEGATAVVDVIMGNSAPAGRLPLTQYPANYIDNNNILDMNLPPSNNIPGRTYMWYEGEAVLPFGFGLHYADFNVTWAMTPVFLHGSSDVATIVKKAGSNPEDVPFAQVSVALNNTAGMTSDYVALLFASSQDAGPAPLPKKRLVAYGRAKGVAVGHYARVGLNITVGALARADETGDRWLYPGTYTLAVDHDAKITAKMTLKGTATKISSLRRR